MSELDKALKLVSENNKKLKKILKCSPKLDKLTLKKITLEQKKQKAFEKVTTEVIKFINDYCHPHCKVIIEDDSAELVEGLCSLKTKAFVKVKKN